MSTTSESYLVGLIGDGITRRLTPPMHETEARNHGLHYLYRPVDLEVIGRPGEDVGERGGEGGHAGGQQGLAIGEVAIGRGRRHARANGDLGHGEARDARLGQERDALADQPGPQVAVVVSASRCRGTAHGERFCPLPDVRVALH